MLTHGGISRIPTLTTTENVYKGVDVIKHACEVYDGTTIPPARDALGFMLDIYKPGRHCKRTAMGTPDYRMITLRYFHKQC